MDIKQNPFSVYDFLGYFTPGAIFLYGVNAAYHHSNKAAPSLEEIANSIGLGKAEAYVPFILTAYALGHLLNFISSITVERYCIWAIGYPSKSLLGLKHPSYFNLNSNFLLRVIIRSIVFILILPVSFMDLILGRVFGLRELYAKQLDSLLISLIQGKVYSLMKNKGGISPESRGNADQTDFFHYAYHYAVEHAPNHLPKMQNYVALYGFLRTLCLLCVVLFWAITWHAFDGILSGQAIWHALIPTIIACYMFFMAFVKFYRRFSLEALMAISVVYPDHS